MADGPNSSCTGVDGRGESCGDHAPDCFTNECDNRLARTFGPVQSNNVTPGPPSSSEHYKKWVPNNLHGNPIDYSYATPIYDSLHGPMVDPDYVFGQRESPFVPIDGEMDWATGLPTGTSCNHPGGTWPMKVPAEVFAWRMREMHYSTLSLRREYCAKLARVLRNSTNLC